MKMFEEFYDILVDISWYSNDQSLFFCVDNERKTSVETSNEFCLNFNSGKEWACSLAAAKFQRPDGIVSFYHPRIFFLPKRLKAGK